MAKRPGGVMVQGTEPTRSQLIPVLGKWEDIGKKAQLGPAIFCIAAFFALQIFSSTEAIIIPRMNAKGGYINPLFWIYTSPYLIVLGVVLTTASLYFIYRLVGKNKSWLILFGAMAFAAYFLWLFSMRGYFGWLYDFFHETLAGGEPDDNGPLLQLFMRHFLGTGFFEETVKAIPVLLLVFLGRYMSPDARAKYGVEEPLDGILIGAASGGGFAIIETLVQYVPRYLSTLWMHMGMLLSGIQPKLFDAAYDQATGQQVLDYIRAGANLLQTDPGIGHLITRSIDLSFGHMAYSGYFGYFIGLSVLKPERRWKILLIGLVSASIPHALWDTVASMDTAPLLAVCALISYAVLAAAILKAREISPNRSLLQPSVIFGSMQTVPAAAAPAVPLAGVRITPVVHAEPALPAYAAEEPAIGSNRLRVGTRSLVIVAGLRLLEHQVPGLNASAPGGPVAEVTRNPNDPNILGLTNLSTGVWETVTASGIRRQIATGQTIKLALGTRIDFGSTDGEVV
ncbi:MAG TPA: PrsW family intramembrane metalloprotease [Terracidiphilus sp.]|nr:PrsW family intramembrane metalloprotease [Terracidiphilus sp.]